ncbi:MAG: PQQ-binding-like beta-propeller repeat protein [Sedimentisphaerales bacterium]|nr:PQQ-binding-like beta-propeller repeat protein [Sedimentisphaerales bacterium]
MNRISFILAMMLLSVGAELEGAQRSHIDYPIILPDSGVIGAEENLYLSSADGMSGETDATGAYLIVPYIYPTIQSALEAASEGDVIVVAPGTYYENIHFEGEDVILTSTNPFDPCIVAQTVIDGGRNDSVVTFEGSETLDCVVTGLTITNGDTEYDTGGGGINLGSADAEISYCVISNNRSEMRGGGIRAENSAATISHCTIEYNRGLDEGGGGIYAIGGSIQVEHCRIVANWTDRARGGGVYFEQTVGASVRYCILEQNGWSEWGHETDYGGAVFLANVTDCVLKHNVISDNRADEGGAISVHDEENPGAPVSTVLIQNCTIVRNFSDWAAVSGWLAESQITIQNSIISENLGDDLWIGTPGNVSYCCIGSAISHEDGEPYDYTIWPGNISANPRLAGGEGVYALLMNSPCIDAGDPCYVADVGETDIDGQGCVIGGRVDIGAYELQPMIEFTGIAPAEGEVWSAGSTHHIQWRSAAVASIDIAYRDDPCGDWQLIDSDCSNMDYYDWTIPGGLESEQCMLKVTSADEPCSVVCSESAVFSVVPYTTGDVVQSFWPQTGGNARHTSLSPVVLPEVGCIQSVQDLPSPVYGSVVIGNAGMYGYDSWAYIPCEDGRLYTACAPGHYLDLMGHYDTGSGLVSSPAIGPDGTIYIGSLDGMLHAVSRSLYELRWKSYLGRMSTASPAIGPDGTIYVGTETGVLYALAPDGSDLWSFTIPGLSADLPGAIMAAPAIADDGTVYVGAMFDPRLYALNPSDGSIKWIAEFGMHLDPDDPCSTVDGPWLMTEPVVADDGTIYVGLDTTSATGTWSYDYVAGSYDYAPLIELCALSPVDGSIVWARYQDTNYLDGLYTYEGYTRPALGPDGTLYVASDYQPAFVDWWGPPIWPYASPHVPSTYIQAIQPNGELKWELLLGLETDVSLMVGADGLIYAAALDGTLYVISPEGQWLSKLDGVTFDGKLACGPNGTIYALRTPTEIVSIGAECQWGSSPPDPLMPLHHLGDLSKDGRCDLEDFALLGSLWQKCNDLYPSDSYLYPYPTLLPWCEELEEGIYYDADLNHDLNVNEIDLAIIAEDWLEGDSWWD